MNFVILFVFSTIVFTVISKSTEDNTVNVGKSPEDNTVSEKSVPGRRNGECKSERVTHHSVSKSNGKKLRNEDKSVDTHAREIEAEIEEMSKENWAVAYKIHAKWLGRAKGRETKLEMDLKDCTLQAKRGLIALDLRYAIEQTPTLFLLTIEQAMDRQGKIMAEIFQSIRTMKNDFINIIKDLIRLNFDNEINLESVWLQLKKFPMVQVQIDQISDPFEIAILKLKNADKVEEAKKIWEESKRLWEARIVVAENKKNGKKEHNGDQIKKSTKKIHLLEDDIPLLENLTSITESKEVQKYVRINVLNKQGLNLLDTEKLYLDYVISVGRVFLEGVTKTYTRCTIALAMTSQRKGKELIDRLKLKKNWEKLDPWDIIDEFCMGESYLWNKVSDADQHGPMTRLAPEICHPEKEDLKNYIDLLFGNKKYVFDVAEYLAELFPRRIEKEE